MTLCLFLGMYFYLTPQMFNDMPNWFNALSMILGLALHAIAGVIWYKTTNRIEHLEEKVKQLEEKTK